MYFQRDDILIVSYTDVGWSPYFPLISGLITEMGGLLSHGRTLSYKTLFQVSIAGTSPYRHYPKFVIVLLLVVKREKSGAGGEQDKEKIDR